MIFNMSGGGGTSSVLNFKVVGGTTQPNSATENTIWVNTDSAISNWHLNALEPDVYDIQPISVDDLHYLIAPHKLSEGDIINFTIPYTINVTYEAIRIYDKTTGNFFCVRQGNGEACTAWPAGTKVGLLISNNIHKIGNWGGIGTAYIYSWDSYYHKEGTVWITTGTYSAACFNALKKNCIQLYPIAAKQYVDGVWADKEAYLGTGNEWVQSGFLKTYIIKHGVFDLTAHPVTSTSTSPDINNYILGDYNGAPAVVLPAPNGAWATTTITNIEVPEGATTFKIEYYRLASYNHNPMLTLGGVAVEVDRGEAIYLLDGQVNMDVSGIVGMTVDLICEFYGCSNNDRSYLKNAWFE